jgi:hypothetical protein
MTLSAKALALFTVLSVFAITDCVAAEPSIDATGWEGLYRSSQGEILRVQAVGPVISIDTFVSQGGAWKRETAWATIMKKADYAEFRQRVEPNGLWLSLSFENNGALVATHDSDLPKSKTTFFKKLDSTESESVRLELPFR